MTIIARICLGFIKHDSAITEQCGICQEIIDICKNTDTQSTCIRIARGANALAKTTESVKLSDLYLLEAQIQSQIRDWSEPTLNER